MATKQNVLITGANRGIGRGLVSAFLQKSKTTVIAAVRDPSNPTSKALNDLPKNTTSSLIIVKLDAADESAAKTAVKTLQAEYGIESLDLVVANAGIQHSGKPVIEGSIDSIQEHINVNAIGPLILFQATAPLLRSSKSGHPKFVAISSITATIAGMEMLKDLPNVSPYGASKAALNWFMRRIHFEEPWLISLVLHPGFVLTDMVAETMKDSPVKPQDMGAITVEESVNGIVERIDNSTREVSGTFQTSEGNTLSW